MVVHHSNKIHDIRLNYSRFEVVGSSAEVSESDFVHVCSSVRADIGIQELAVDVVDVCAELEDPLE